MKKEKSKKVIFYDLETTGLSSKKDKIVEIAALDFHSKETFQRLVNPKMPIPIASSKALILQ